MRLNDIVLGVLFLGAIGCSNQKIMKNDYNSCNKLNNRLPDSLIHWIKDDCYHFKDTIIYKIDSKCIQTVKDSVKFGDSTYSGWR